MLTEHSASAEPLGGARYCLRGLVRELGVEPRFTGSEPGVLPIGRFPIKSALWECWNIRIQLRRHFCLGACSPDATKPGGHRSHKRIDRDEGLEPSLTEGQSLRFCRLN